MNLKDIQINPFITGNSTLLQSIFEAFFIFCRVSENDKYVNASASKGKSSRKDYA
jgi:hypothetical protein